MKVILVAGITAILELDERDDLTMKIAMLPPKLSLSALMVPDEALGDMEPSPEQALDLRTIALNHVLQYLAKAAKENVDLIGEAPTQLMPEGAKPS